MRRLLTTAAALMAALAVGAPRTQAQARSQASMPVWPLGSGWRLTGMAQAFPVVTLGAPGESEPLGRTGWYLTQPALMANLEGPEGRLVLRATLNFEGLTQEEGELTYGGWGEGFIDKRHPHTLVHELMLSYDLWDVGGGSLSLSAGKGFAPYGTSDPMARPGLKYPTNHHLSQILERWLVGAAWIRQGLSVEAGVFGGSEPDGPYDFSNIESFPDSWSARVALRWGTGTGPWAAWEVSASVAAVTEEEHVPSGTPSAAVIPHEHGGPAGPGQPYAVVEGSRVYVNAALRHETTLGPGHLYALLEGSRSRLDSRQDFFSVLGEAHYAVSGHEPYVRAEYARRPEYGRLGSVTQEEFFRYEHHHRPIGTTRWLILTAGYGDQLTPDPWSVRPFLEVQHHRVRPDQGAVTPGVLYGTTGAWMLTLGARVYLGGGPMRMGSYGVLDPVSVMLRGMEAGTMEHMQH